MEITKEEFWSRAKALYGEDTVKWRFKCPSCKRVQSGETVRLQLKMGVGSQRHGVPEAGANLGVYCECYSPTCNWVAYGLFTSNILIIIDPSKPHNEALKENCTYVFPLADDAEMLAAAGCV